jgi:hypothetical protein
VRIVAGLGLIARLLPARYAVRIVAGLNCPGSAAGTLEALSPKPTTEDQRTCGRET